MRTRNVVLLAVAGAIGGIAVIAAAVAGFFYFAANGLSRREPTAEEKKLVITSQRMSEYAEGVDASCEKLTSKRGIDGTREIESDYFCEDSALIYTSSAEISRNALEARQSFRLGVVAYAAGARIGGVTVHHTASLLQAGDEHFAAELRQNDKPVGNVFVVRQGRIVLSLFLVGVYFDDAEDAKALMDPLLQEAARR
jgi:hypothetical protein